MRQLSAVHCLLALEYPMFRGGISEPGLDRELLEGWIDRWSPYSGNVVSRQHPVWKHRATGGLYRARFGESATGFVRILTVGGLSHVGRAGGFAAKPVAE